MKYITTWCNNNYEINNEGFVRNKKTHKFIKPTVKNTYHYIRLSKDGKVHGYLLHRLVYISFKGKIKNGNHINHINGNRIDNKLSNLEEVTPMENYKKMLFIRKGHNVSTSKLTEKQVMEIRNAKKNGENSRLLADKYGVVKSTINRIAKGIYWKHIKILPVDNSIWSDCKKTGAMSRQSIESKYGKEYWIKISKGKKFVKHCSTCTCCK